MALISYVSPTNGTCHRDTSQRSTQDTLGHTCVPNVNLYTKYRVRPARLPEVSDRLVGGFVNPTTFHSSDTEYIFLPCPVEHIIRDGVSWWKIAHASTKQGVSYFVINAAGTFREVLYRYDGVRAPTARDLSYPGEFLYVHFNKNMHGLAPPPTVNNNPFANQTGGTGSLDI